MAGADAEFSGFSLDSRQVEPGSVFLAIAGARVDGHEFAEEVIEVNNEFPTNYSFLFGGARCSCGVAYDPESVKDVLK